MHEGPATTLDLTATFLDSAGVAIPPDMDSRSMRPLLAGQVEQHREYVFSGLKEWRMVFDGRWKYVRGYREAGEMLFDQQTDRAEEVNLIDRPAFREEGARLARLAAKQT